MTTQEEFRAANIRRSSPTQPLDSSMASLALYGLGIGGEAGEVEDEIKKVLFHGKPLDVDHILKECGDVLWYMDRLLTWLGDQLTETFGPGQTITFTFSDVMAINKAKLDERYPTTFDMAPKRFGWDEGLEGR